MDCTAGWIKKNPEELTLKYYKGDIKANKVQKR